MRAYPRTEEEPGRYARVSLISYKLTEGAWTPVGEIDLSDDLRSRTFLLRAIRLIDSVIVVCMDRSYVAVDVTDPTALKQIDVGINVLKTPQLHDPDRDEEFTIPLLPVQGISVNERIKLSIDIDTAFLSGTFDSYETSIVDVTDGGIAFFLASINDIARYDVTRWDQENIYCRFSTARPFTILEKIEGFGLRHAFVKAGRLYCRLDQGTLLVFDIRSNRKIRKLGHFVRMGQEIDDIEVLDDGNILLSLTLEDVLPPSDHDRRAKVYLCLLEDPA
jgi:hypothetical protein